MSAGPYPPNIRATISGPRWPTWLASRGFGDNCVDLLVRIS